MALTYNNMAKIMYTINQPFKELYKKGVEPQQQLLEYLEYSLVTVRLSKPLTQTKKVTANHVREIVFRGCNTEYVMNSLDDMLKALDNYVEQQLRRETNLLEDVLIKINSLRYNCLKQAKLYDRHSLFYRVSFNANWECMEKESSLSLEQLELLCGNEIGDLINYNIDLRKEFWTLAADHLKYLHDGVLSIKNHGQLLNFSNRIPVPFIVELTHLFKDKKYITNDKIFVQFETAICTLLAINKEAYKKAKSAFKNKARNKYHNLERIVEELS